MSIKNGDLPAMPNETDSHTLGCMGLMNTVADCYGHRAGLTKREMFAMTAMQGILSADANNDVTYQECAAWSVKQADALLAELEKSK